MSYVKIDIDKIVEYFMKNGYVCNECCDNAGKCVMICDNCDPLKNHLKKDITKIIYND